MAFSFYLRDWQKVRRLKEYEKEKMEMVFTVHRFFDGGGRIVRIPCHG